MSNLNISFKQYRAIDLTIFAVIMLIFETVTAKAAVQWFPDQLYALSPTVAVVCIVMMRWGPYGAIHALLGGFAFCFASGANGKQFIIYCVGNCFALAALGLFKLFGKKKIKDKFGYTVLFTLAAFLGVQLGRWLISLPLGGSPDSIIVFLTTDSLSLLFAVVVVLISRRVDGLFEDQKSYLIRADAERRRQEGEEFYNS